MASEDDGYYSGNSSFTSLDMTLEESRKQYDMEHLQRELLAHQESTSQISQAGIEPAIPVATDDKTDVTTAGASSISAQPQLEDTTLPDASPSVPEATSDVRDLQTILMSRPPMTDTASVTEYDGSDADSAYDNASLVGDDTKSLASSILDYREEHGRRYHAYRDGAYWVSQTCYRRSN
jgi:hypothetical protein